LALVPSNQLQAAQNASNGNGSLPSSVSAKHSTEHSPPTSSIGTIDTLCMEALNAIDQGQYQKAIDLYQQAFPTIGQALDPTLNKTPADVLYNIGNCHYHLEQAGPAALAWRRALARQSDHLRARKNLRYLELKEGASSPAIEQWQQKLSTLPLSLYQNLYRASLWILLIVILSLRLIKAQGKALQPAPQPIFQPMLITLLFLMPTTAIIGASACYFFPDTEVHTPFDQQAVCLKKTPIYPEAHRDAQASMSLPPCSLLTINSSRDSWLHISTAEGQSGWVKANSIARVEEAAEKSH
jgi:tetratricopeptide (TPR) repeat protein